MKTPESEAKAIVLEDTVRGAIDGDRAALETLVRALQGNIYGLALRICYNVPFAESRLINDSQALRLRYRKFEIPL